MPAVNTMETRVKMTGEKEYREAIQDANRQLKLLRSELKQEISAMGADTDAKKKNAAQIANLKKQYDAQAKIVAEMEKRLKKMQESGKSNDAEITNFTIKLRDAQTAMNKTGSAIQSLTQQQEELGKQSEESGKQFSNGFVKNLEFNAAFEKFRNLGSVVSGVFSGITNAARGVINSVVGITDAVSKAADDMMTLSQTSGIDIQTLLQMSAAEKLGYDVSAATFAGAAQKLGTSRGGSAFATGKYNKKTNTWEGRGLFADLLEANPDATNLDLMWMVLNRASTLYDPNGDNSALDSAMMAALGRSYTDFRPYLLDGGVSYREYVNQANQLGVVRTEEQTTELASISDYIAKTETLRDSIAKLFVYLNGEDFKAIITAFNNVLAAINQYFNPDDGVTPTQAIENLNTALGELAEAVWLKFKKYIEDFWQFVQDLSDTKGENGEPTPLASIANRLLALKEWFATDWPKWWAEIKQTFTTLGAIIEKIGGWLGIGDETTNGSGEGGTQAAAVQGAATQAAASFGAPAPKYIDIVPPTPVTVNEGAWNQTPAAGSVISGSNRYSAEQIANIAAKAAASGVANYMNGAVFKADGKAMAEVTVPYIQEEIAGQIPLMSSTGEWFGN